MNKRPKRKSQFNPRFEHEPIDRPEHAERSLESKITGLNMYTKYAEGRPQ